MDDQTRLQHTLGMLEERTAELPQMAKDLATVMAKLETLPCKNHTASLAELSNSTASVAPKIKFLWQLLMCVATAIIGGVVVAIANAQMLGVGTPQP